VFSLIYFEIESTPKAKLMLTALAISETGLETPFLALRTYYGNLGEQDMINFVDSLKQKRFHRISWEDLLKYTLDDYKELDKILGATLQRIFRSLLGIIVCSHY
jgi:hypothetical protein